MVYKNFKADNTHISKDLKKKNKKKVSIKTTAESLSAFRTLL